MLITCEHGGNTIPVRYAPLFHGTQKLLKSHRGHDIGALNLARYLARHLRAPLHYSTVSRLLVDLNRSPHHRQLFSSQTRVLDPASRTAVLARYYSPYRGAVEKRIVQMIARGRSVVHVSAHSFTPVFDSKTRMADIGLLYDPARRGERLFCTRFQDALSDFAPTLRVRRNYPYKGTADGFTTYLRKIFSGTHYAGIELEVNQRFFLDAKPAWGGIRLNILRALTTIFG
ncbi:MAG: N-formylglutamate amidohydrolase [Gammaproteobacteria bacterium]|nr:MAG: N-formylglutamate amidohydrolase [Gammaproteobacteria bacterium]